MYLATVYMCISVSECVYNYVLIRLVMCENNNIVQCVSNYVIYMCQIRTWAILESFTL